MEIKTWEVFKADFFQNFQRIKYVTGNNFPIFDLNFDFDIL